MSVSLTVHCNKTKCTGTCPPKDAAEKQTNKQTEYSRICRAQQKEDEGAKQQLTCMRGRKVSGKLPWQVKLGNFGNVPNQKLHGN